MDNRRDRHSNAHDSILRARHFATAARLLKENPALMGDYPALEAFLTEQSVELTAHLIRGGVAGTHIRTIPEFVDSLAWCIFMAAKIAIWEDLGPADDLRSKPWRDRPPPNVSDGSGPGLPL